MAWWKQKEDPITDEVDPSEAMELEHLYQRAPIALCVTDTEHRYVRINQRLCDINGKSMRKHLGRTVHEVIPDLAYQIVPIFQKVIDTVTPVLDYEVLGTTLRHPGEERVFLGNHYPLISKSGEVLYVHTMVRDITEQKRAEANLRGLNERLEERVTERTADLTRVSEELKTEALERIRAEKEAVRHQAELAHVTRVRSMGELAASISHELNQPLTAVLTNAQTALRLLAKEKPDLKELQEILEDIVADDKRAGQVIRKLRALLQKEPVAREVVRIDELVEGVLPLVRSDALGANVRINVRSAPNVPAVEVDPVQVQQVVMNLLVNAIDAIAGLESGGGDIDVDISLAEEEGVWVKVGDNGPGIPSERIDEVFEPFVTSKAGGLGMGLAISRSIVEAHGGTIFIESGDPRGCSVSFMLPLTQPAES